MGNSNANDQERLNIKYEKQKVRWAKARARRFVTVNVKSQKLRSGAMQNIEEFDTVEEIVEIMREVAIDNEIENEYDKLERAIRKFERPDWDGYQEDEDDYDQEHNVDNEIIDNYSANVEAFMNETSVNVVTNSNSMKEVIRGRRGGRGGKRNKTKN